MSARPKIFTVRTPVKSIEEVTLYEDTFHDHISVRHPEAASQDSIRQTLADPSFVVGNTPSPERVAYVNMKETSSGGNSPFTVYVDKGEQCVVTATFDRRYRGGADGQNAGPILHKRDEEKADG